MPQKLIPGFPYKEVYKASHAKAVLKPNYDPITDGLNGNTDKSRKAAKYAFDKFAGQLPVYSGIFVLIGIDKQNKEKILAVCKFPLNSRLEFKAGLTINGEVISRQDWLNRKLILHNLKQIKIKIASYE